MVIFINNNQRIKKMSMYLAVAEGNVEEDSPEEAGMSTVDLVDVPLK